MRISDWSSDVCSSDLDHVAGERVAVVHEAVPGLLAGRKAGVVARGHHMGLGADAQGEDWKSVVSGKSVSVRVDIGGRRIIKKKNTVVEYVKDEEINI